MSEAKKYYWLKLKDDFFSTKEIKKLRKIAGGDTYTIIYLKMQLLSIKKEGLLIYEGTEENLIEQLTLELDEDIDNIKITLAFLQANRLIEQIADDEFMLNKVIQSIGSETTAAERMRQMREKRNNVTPMLQSVTQREEIREKRIDIKDTVQPKEVERFFEEVWKIYPSKRGKGKISYTKKKELYKLGDEFKKCISRYETDVTTRKADKFGELSYQNGSTFFNSGYVDYLDENFEGVDSKILGYTFDGSGEFIK